MDKIRALTFDLDDTLWDNRPVLMTAEHTLYTWLSTHYPAIRECYTPEQLRDLRNELVHERPALGHNMTELRKASLRRAAETAGYDQSLVEPAFEIFLEARHRITLYDDVLPALGILRQAGYRLGSLTNGNADVKRLGLDDLFDFSLTAESVGKAKPHPDMYQLACKRAGVAASQLAHIGDDPITDLMGGNAAGVFVIWMNRACEERGFDIEPDAEICNMSELLSLFGLSLG